MSKKHVLYLDGFEVKMYHIHRSGWATVITMDGSESLIRPSRVVAMLAGQTDPNNEAKNYDENSIR